MSHNFELRELNHNLFNRFNIFVMLTDLNIYAGKCFKLRYKFILETFRSKD